MLLEFCEMGPLKTWLTNQRTSGKIHDDVIDSLFFIVYGVAKGMEYLAYKDVRFNSEYTKILYQSVSIHTNFAF